MSEHTSSSYLVGATLPPVALSLATACLLTAPLLAFWLLDYFLAAEIGFLGYATLFVLLPAGLQLRLHAHLVQWLGSKLP